ncbi:MAG: hypothetical protein HQL64_08730 [Magnetococcales bacterium]|nr:hypothetical protein [Magnetococcales bacterium]
MNQKILLLLVFSLLAGCQKSWQHSLLQGDNADVKTARGKEWMPPPNPDDTQQPPSTESKKKRQ